MFLSASSMFFHDIQSVFILMSWVFCSLICLLVAMPHFTFRIFVLMHPALLFGWDSFGYLGFVCLCVYFRFAFLVLRNATCVSQGLP